MHCSRIRTVFVLLAAFVPAAGALAQASRPASRPAASRPAASRPAVSPATAAAQRERARVERLGRELSALFVKLASENKEHSRAARDRIIDLSQEERIAGLGYEAEKLYAWYRKSWADQALVTVEVRAQKSTLLGLDTVPVSLGLGRPVQLQLPRTYTISIGTTVSLPAGR